MRREVERRRDDCEFCAIAAGDTHLFSTNPHVRDAFLPPYQSVTCVAWPDAAPLVPGHVLIVPRQHALSVARLDEAVREDLLEDVTAIVSQLLERDRTPVVFEHGSNKLDEATGCSITHVHLHVVPVETDVLEASDVLSTFTKFDDLRTAWNTMGDEDYYLIGRFEGPAYGSIIKERPELKCQMFLRKVIASAIGEPERADYRRYEGTSEPPDDLVPSILETYSKLQRVNERGENGRPVSVENE